MAHSYVHLIYHIVFATKDRYPLITEPIRDRLFEYLGGMIRQTGGVSLGVGGTNNHVHILAKIRQDKALSDVIKDLKANSTNWVHETFPTGQKFYWQSGYGAFTVSESQVEVVRNYVLNQEKHHQKRTFEEEFIQLLRVHGVEFDERYLWK